MAGYFTRQQVVALLRDIEQNRVHRTQNQDHLETWDVRATLTRIFGFDGWALEFPRPAEFLFEEPCEIGRDKRPGQKVAFIATARLTLFPVIRHEGTAVGASSMGTHVRDDCYDMAVKTAESQALKRAAMNMGTQFGLSLYNDGSRADVVGPLVMNPEPTEEEINEAVKIIQGLTDAGARKAYWHWLTRIGLSREEAIIDAYRVTAPSVSEGSSQSD